MWRSRKIETISRVGDGSKDSGERRSFKGFHGRWLMLCFCFCFVLYLDHHYKIIPMIVLQSSHLQHTTGVSKSSCVFDFWIFLTDLRHLRALRAKKACILFFLVLVLILIFDCLVARRGGGFKYEVSSGRLIYRRHFGKCSMSLNHPPGLYSLGSVAVFKKHNTQQPTTQHQQQQLNTDDIIDLHLHTLTLMIRLMTLVSRITILCIPTGSM